MAIWQPLDARHAVGMMGSSGSMHGRGGSMAALPPRREKTVFLVKFAQSVLTRDAAMG